MTVKLRFRDYFSSKDLTSLIEVESIADMDKAVSQCSSCNYAFLNDVKIVDNGLVKTDYYNNKEKIFLHLMRGEET